jgi:hypothetical protein
MLSSRFRENPSKGLGLRGVFSRGELVRGQGIRDLKNSRATFARLHLRGVGAQLAENGSHSDFGARDMQTVAGVMSLSSPSRRGTPLHQLDRVGRGCARSGGVETGRSESAARNGSYWLARRSPKKLLRAVVARLLGGKMPAWVTKRLRECADVSGEE